MDLSQEAGTSRAGDRAAAAAGMVLLTLASAQFLMTLDSSVMNVSIATVAKDVGTTVTGIQTAITFQGTLSSWWTKIVVGVLLLVFCLLQKAFERKRSTGGSRPSSPARVPVQEKGRAVG